MTVDSHPSAVQTDDGIPALLHNTEDQCFLVMPFVEGSDLKETANQYRGFETVRLIQIVRSLALAFASTGAADHAEGEINVRRRRPVTLVATTNSRSIGAFGCIARSSFARLQSASQRFQLPIESRRERHVTKASTGARHGAFANGNHNGRAR